MNFFHSLFKSKLDAMRAAAPRASIHLLHESNGFSIYLDEAAAVRKLLPQFGTFTDHAEDILEETVPVLFIPLEQCVRFVEEVTVHHSVALVDVILADKVHAARYVMYAYFGKRTDLVLRKSLPELSYPKPNEEEVLLYMASTQKEYGKPACPVSDLMIKTGSVFGKLSEKESLDANFWG